MAYLPNEMLVHIFEYLPMSDRLMCSLVCKHWCSVIKTNHLHKNVVAKFNGDKLFQICFIDFVQNSLSKITKLCLKEVTLKKDILNYETVSGFFSELISLSLENCDMTEHDLEAILRHCSNLESLHLILMVKSLKSGRFLENEKDQKILRANLVHVTELNLMLNPYLSDVLLNRIANCVINLESLDLSYNHITSGSSSDQHDLTLVHLSFENILKLISDRAQKITSLNFDRSILDDSTLQRIAKIPDLKLEVFSMESSTCNQQALLSLVQNHKLKKLDLDYSKTVLKGDPKVIKFIFQEMKCIQELSLEDLPLNGELHECLGMLDNLTLINCSKLDVMGNSLRDLKDLKSTFEISHNFRHYLTTLNLSFSNTVSKDICDIIPLVPNLKKLILKACLGVDSDVIASISRNLTKLETLSLARAHCKNLSDTDFQLKHQSETGIELKSLEKLDLSCTSIGEKALEILEINQLRFIDLSFCPNITDQGFIILGQKNPSLEAVSLQKCSITNHGLLEMLRFTKRLTRLNIRNCLAISLDKIFVELPNLCPYLTYLLLSLNPKECDISTISQTTPLWRSIQRGAEIDKLSMMFE